MTEPALFNVRQAAIYMGCSRAFFEENIRPYIPTVDLRRPGGEKPMPRWQRSELDRFIESRRPKAVAS